MVQEGARGFRDWSENAEASYHWGLFKTVYLIFSYFGENIFVVSDLFVNYFCF